MAILKQINLIQKSNNEDSLAATYNGCAESSFIDTGNIYEFIFQSKEILGSQGQRLTLAVQLAHSTALLGAELTRFIMNHMVVKKQPCVSFKTELTFDCEQYICGKASSVSAKEIGNFDENINWQYSTPMQGKIVYVENQININDRSKLKTSIADNNTFVLRSTGNKASFKLLSLENESNINDIYYKTAMDIETNTTKYSKGAPNVFIEAQISGITTPMYSNDPATVSDYNLNMYLLRTYEFAHKNNGSDYSSGAMKVASYIRGYGIKGIMGCSGDDCYFVLTKDARGIIGKNQKESIETIGFLLKDIKTGTVLLNINKTMVRSSYYDSEGKFYLPFAVNKLTKVDSDKSDIVYGGGDINSLFLASISSLQTNHEAYRKESPSFTGVTDEEPEKAENMASGVDTSAVLPIYDASGKLADVSADIYEGLRNFAARVQKLGYILKMHEGDYYVVPNVLILSIPSQDGKIQAGATWGDILKTYNISKEAFCGANRINIYKFSESEECKLGQVYRIPVHNADQIIINEDQMMGNYSGYNKVPNNLYVPSESGTETYESLTIDDRDELDQIVREKDENGQDTDKIKWSSFGRYLVRIGDCTLPISPQQIKVQNASGSESVQTMRSRSAMKLKSGYSQEVVKLDMTFVGAAQINGSAYYPYPDDEEIVYYRNGLRPLLAQFIKAPFLPIENELLNEEFQIYSVCLQGIEIHTMPGFPNGIQATLTLLPFDHTVFLSGEEFFEGTFCWPLFRWYYQQKMIGDTYTKLDLFDITHHTSSTVLNDTSGGTRTIYYDSSKVLTLAIPQESFLKERKAAIYELYKKKAPNLYEDTSLNWKKLCDNEKDNARLNISHGQFVSFQSFKNAHHKDDYPEFYDDNGVFTLEKIAPIAEEMKGEDFEKFQEWDIAKKVKMVCYLSDFINCYMTTYQVSSILGFVIKGLTKDLIKTSVDLMKKDMENLYYSGEEDEQFLSLNQSEIAPFKPTIDEYVSNIDIIKYYQSMFTQKDDVNSLAIGLAAGGSLAMLGSAAIFSIATGILAAVIGWPLLIAGAVVLGAGLIIGANNDSDAEWYNKIEMYDYKEMNDWSETINNYGGELAIRITDSKSIDKYIKNNTCIASGQATSIDGSEPVGTLYYMIPNALMDDMGGYIGTNEAKEEYKNYIENLQYIAHQTEQDIPFETIILPEMYITEASCSMSNAFAPLQTQMNSTPVYQYMGGTDVTLVLTCKTNSRDNIEQLWRAVKKSQYFAREYKIAITSGIMRIDHPFLSLMGVKEVLIEDVSIETDRESAEGFNITLTISSFDKTQKHREELTSDGFGVAFQSVDQWKQYTRQKRAGTGFDYGHMDFALKEAELYPDLELPTYEEVNRFLQKHPITDKFGVVFDRYENITNCKYVDPDFYIRTEETLRDYVENNLLYANNNSVVVSDQYGNAYCEKMPTNEQQMSTVDSEGNDKEGDYSSELDIVANDEFKDNLIGSLDRMKELDQMALYGELPGSIMYDIQKDVSVADNNMSDEDKAKSASNWSEVKDLVSYLVDNKVFQFDVTDDKGEKKTIGFYGTTYLNIGKETISAMVEIVSEADSTTGTTDEESKQKKKDWKKQLKALKKSLNDTAELSVYCIDRFDYLAKFDPNKTGIVKDLKNVLGCSMSLKGEVLTENFHNHSNRPEKSLSATFLGLYFLSYICNQSSVSDINSIDVKDWYMVIEVEHPSSVISAYNFKDKNTIKDNYKENHPCCFLQDLQRVKNKEITFDDLLNGPKYHYRETFENAGVFVYKRGAEETQSVKATQALKDKFGQESSKTYYDQIIKNHSAQSLVSAETARDELKIDEIVDETKKVVTLKDLTPMCDIADLINPRREVGYFVEYSNIKGLSLIKNSQYLYGYIVLAPTIDPDTTYAYQAVVVNPDRKGGLSLNPTKQRRLIHLVYFFTKYELVMGSKFFIVLNPQKASILGFPEVNAFFKKHNEAVQSKKKKNEVTEDDVKEIYNLFKKNGVSFLSTVSSDAALVGVDDNTTISSREAGSLGDLTNSIAAMGLDNALKAENQNRLFRSSFADMMRYDHRGRLVRAFPTYHMFIIDEGQDNVFWSMWDNFYGYNSLLSIDLYKDRRIIADTLKVQMTNIYHNLSSIDTELDYSKDKYSFFDIFTKEYWKDAVNVVLNTPDLDLLRLKQNKATTMLLQPGARIHMRMGYGADAFNLPVVFNGTITECNTGELVEFIAQGDGVELTNKLNASPKDTTDKSCMEMPMQPRQVIGNMMNSRGSFFSNIINAVTSNTFKKKNPLGIAHFGNKGEVSKMTKWQEAPIFFGWWSRITAVESETNNYGPSLLNVYGGGPERSMSNWAMTDLNSHSPDFDGSKFKWKLNPLADKSEVNYLPRVRIYLYDMTTNDVCQMLAATCSDYICAVVPFELRSTLFFGRPHWGCATEYINTYTYNLTYNQCEKQQVGYVRHSFSQARMYNSYTDIIANDITTSTDTMKTNMIGYYNEKDGAKQTAVVQVDSDLDDDCQTTGIVHLPIKADWGIPTWLGYNYKHQGKYAEIAAISEMKSLMGTMYDGELIVIADPSAKPYDCVYLEDAYKDMAGAFTIRSVHHSMSIDGGFMSSITPDLISIYDDQQLLTFFNRNAAISSVALTGLAVVLRRSVVWKKLVSGPIGHRVKQIGNQALNYGLKKMYGHFSDDGLAKNFFDLADDEIMRSIETASSATEAAQIGQQSAEKIFDMSVDKYKFTQTINKYAKESGADLKTVFENADFQKEIKNLGLKHINVDEIDPKDLAKYMLSDKDSKLFEKAIGSCKDIDAAQKAAEEAGKLVKTNLDDMAESVGKITSKKGNIKINGDFSKKMKNTLESLKDTASPEELKKLEELVNSKALSKSQFDEFLELSNKLNNKAIQNNVDDAMKFATKNIDEVAGKAKASIGKAIENCNTKFINSAQNRVENLTDCIQEKKLLSTTKNKITNLFAKKGSQEVAEKLTQEGIENFTEEGAKKAVKQMVNETMNKAVKNSAGKVTEEMFEKGLKEAIGEAGEKLTKESLEKITESVTKKMFSELGEEVAEKTIQKGLTTVFKKGGSKAIEEVAELGAKKGAAKVLTKVTNKTLTGSLKGLFDVACISTGPVGWAVKTVFDIAIDQLIGTAFEAYCRWKRRRQCLILMPMQFQHNTFVVGLDGHQGCLMGDQPSKTDMILMGETLWGTPFKVLNFLSGSDYDYAHEDLATTYNNWAEQVNAWDADEV